MSLRYQVFNFFKLPKNVNDPAVKLAQDKRDRKAFKFQRDYWRSIHCNPCIHPELNPK